MNEKILENKRLFLNFLGVTHSRGVVDKEIFELREKFDSLIRNLEPKTKLSLENTLEEMLEIVKDRYFEYGAIVKEIETDYIND